MRVIGGSARGRRLVVPRGRATRPTAGRVREALFDILGDSVHKTVVLDLFAGSGALGIEALSRGAGAAFFVEAGATAVGCLRRNLENLGFDAQSTVIKTDSLAYLQKKASASGSFDLIFADPPYTIDMKFYRSLLAMVGRQGILRPRGRLILEHPARGGEVEAPPEWIPVEHRRYGETAITIFMPALGGPQERKV